uniref:Peptidase S1 domain-containing protein n=1 Tax=Timema cristinae TaxID=61476 RepID=A0A7R9HA44_TIMCR|nr:unnamed protein product [Timema cristinae]
MALSCILSKVSGVAKATELPFAWPGGGFDALPALTAVESSQIPTRFQDKIDRIRPKSVHPAARRINQYNLKFSVNTSFNPYDELTLDTFDRAQIAVPYEEISSLGGDPENFMGVVYMPHMVKGSRTSSASENKSVMIVQMMLVSSLFSHRRLRTASIGRLYIGRETHVMAQSASFLQVLAPAQRPPLKESEPDYIVLRGSNLNGTVYYSFPHIRSERNVLDIFSYLHINGSPHTGSDRIVKLNVELERNESGDSGGPVVYKGKLIGIVSLMLYDDCMSRLAPHLHTQVISYLKWIQKYLKV